MLILLCSLVGLFVVLLMMVEAGYRRDTRGVSKRRSKARVLFKESRFFPGDQPHTGSSAQVWIPGGCIELDVAGVSSPILVYVSTYTLDRFTVGDEFILSYRVGHSGELYIERLEEGSAC